MTTRTQTVHVFLLYSDAGRLQTFDNDKPTDARRVNCFYKSTIGFDGAVCRAGREVFLAIRLAS